MRAWMIGWKWVESTILQQITVKYSTDFCFEHSHT